MKILVTGFIGSHLAIKLLERGDEVIGLDNINDYYDQNVKYGIIDSKNIPYGKVLILKLSCSSRSLTNPDVYMQT